MASILLMRRRNVINSGNLSGHIGDARTRIAGQRPKFIFVTHNHLAVW